MRNQAFQKTAVMPLCGVSVRGFDVYRRRGSPARTPTVNIDGRRTGIRDQSETDFGLDEAVQQRADLGWMLVGEVVKARHVRRGPRSSLQLRCRLTRSDELPAAMNAPRVLFGELGIAVAAQFHSCTRGMPPRSCPRRPWM
jgi:hypothetical protein